MGPVHGERNGSSSHFSPQPPKLNRKRGTLQKGGREEDKKTRSVLLVSQLVASKGCPLSAGCWSSLLRGSRLSFTGLLSACAKEQENGCAKVDARPKQATAFEPLSEKALVKRASALDLEVLLLGEGLMPLDWLERGEVRVRGMGFFSWCANAHFRFPFTSRGSRGSYAAAFPGPFLLVLRPEAIASS
ncbi:hypothetical protein KIW84_MT0048 (mitochondrion) [Lathyrus oleraceus]|nr:hypothetical protein KIW84_MT0048 [Pisum sativum]